MATFKSSGTDKDVKVQPTGTGKVVVGTGAAAATVASDGDNDLVLQTGNATTGTITVTDGANGDISLTPNGTGSVVVSTQVESDTIKPTTTDGSLFLKGDFGGSATTNGVTVNSSGNTSITGTTTVSSLVATTADINGGTINDTVIGGTTPAAGTFTTFTSTGIDDNLTSGGPALTIDSSGNVQIANSLTAGTLGSGVVFPSRHIVQTVFNTHAATSTFTSNTPTAVANLTKAITLKTSNPYILVILALNSVGKGSSNTALGINLTANDSGSLDIKLSDIIGYTAGTQTNYCSGFQSYFHNLTSDSSGTTITYTPKFYSTANSAAVYINNNYSTGLPTSQIILMEIQK